MLSYSVVGGMDEDEYNEIYTKKKYVVKFYYDDIYK